MTRDLWKNRKLLDTWPTPMTDPEIIKQAAANYRDRQFAEMLTMMLALAAETHADILRGALAKVFDMSAVERTTERVMASLNQLHKQHQAVLTSVMACNERLQRLEARIAALDEYLDRRARELAPNGPTKTTPPKGP